MLPLNELQLPMLLLYAETHFKFFRNFPSLLFKKAPEVLFDLPHRIGPDDSLPILLLINDVGIHDAEPLNVAITVSRKHYKTTVYRFTKCADFEVDHPFRFNQRAYIFHLEKSGLPEGQLFINATVTLKTGKREWTVFNDNFNTSSKCGYRCYRSVNHLPGNELCSYGDLHFHSQFSQSHVEFGPPLSVIDWMARSSGLSFIGITDHSYDLSCKLDNYLEEDQLLARWELQKKLLSDASSFATILLPGEEISCENSAGATIHLGALGITEFIAGSRDGARKNCASTKQLTIKQAIEAIQKQGGIAFAAHPGSSIGLIQRLFLSRGTWSEQDLQQKIDALQALNDGFNSSWHRAKRLWLNLLQKGYRIPLIGGNDAHGDFNRYRAIKAPFLSIHEDFQRFMGYGKTGIFGKPATREKILASLRKGAAFVTTGPYLSINYAADPNSHAISTNVQTTPGETFYLHCISSKEYGTIQRLSVYSGSVGRNKPESIIYASSSPPGSYEVNIPINLPQIAGPSYIRAEGETVCSDGTTAKVFTNCCFFNSE